MNEKLCDRILFPMFWKEQQQQKKKNSEKNKEWTLDSTFSAHTDLKDRGTLLLKVYHEIISDWHVDDLKKKRSKTQFSKLKILEKFFSVWPVYKTWLLLFFST